IAVLFFFAVYAGIKEVDQRLVERVRTLGGGRSILLREVYLPAVTAWALSNLKVAVGFAFTGAVVGEFVASSRGLGYPLSFAQSTYNASLTLALLLLVIVFVFVLFALAGILETRLLRWRWAQPVRRGRSHAPSRLSRSSNCLFGIAYSWPKDGRGSGPVLWTKELAMIDR